MGDESMFGRLFTFARSTHVTQIENFTTEALAASIRSDHRPFTRVLARYGVLAVPPVAASTLVATQEVVAGVGIVDPDVPAQGGQEGALESSWIRKTDSWQALGKTHRAATVEGIESAVAWFESCLADLETAGILPTPSLAPSAPGR